MKETIYVVYHVKHNDDVVYIGYGNHKRPKHATSGVSNNYHLNRLHHTGESLTTSIVFRTSNKSAAVEREKQDILEYRPAYNTVYLSPLRQDKANAANIVYARIRGWTNRLKDEMRNNYTSRTVSNIYETLFEIFSLIELRNGVRIDTLENKPFPQLKRFIRGDECSEWYKVLMSTDFLEVAYSLENGYTIKLLL